MNNWQYKGQPFLIAPEAAVGFVYLITNLAYNKRYIGKKQFWSIEKLKPLKGMKNKRHRRVETDWQDYWGSNTTLQKDLEILGEDNFRRGIILLCDSKSSLSYHEARLQFEHNVLTDNTYYNGIINCRINGRGMASGTGIIE